MKVVGLSGSIIGSKTKIAMTYAMERIQQQFPNIETVLLDLGEFELAFSDGRDYREYTDDTNYVATQLMEADAIIVGTPTYQASLPGALKNVFDLLPIDAFKGKTASLIATAGSPRHFLMAEQLIKPILAYMKARIVTTYVFIEDKDYEQKQLVNQDVLERLNELVDDTVYTHKAMTEVRHKQ